VVRNSVTSVVGRYELMRELGHGGTATVFLARQTDLDRLVALKELSALPVSDPSMGRRFLRESRLAGSLNHPNVVTVHDYLEHDGTPYIAMEYFPRGSLRPLLGRRLTFAQVAGVLEGLLAGLGHAQESGIVHRDLKPENLMITGDGRVKIADFGIAKVVDQARAGTALTVKGTTIGTPTYMAPEQAMGRDVGPWTDMYAVGVIAFELFAGRTPFDQTGAPMAILLRHVNEAPLTLASVDPSIDPRVSDWIDRLLLKDPEERRHSASSAWLAFEEVVLDRVGPRWRHEAALPAPRATLSTPATVPMASGAVATVMPRRAAPAAAVPTGRRRDGRTPRRLARSLLFLTALVVAVVAAVAGATGGGGGVGGASPPADRGAATAAPAAAPASEDAGVGDSQSDDPSDDEPDGGEP
jgi:Protein kinase domain